MALPTTQLSLNSTRWHFYNSSAPNNAARMSNLYRGGGRVPADQPDSGYGLIPTTGEIGMSKFRGAVTRNYTFYTSSGTWTAPASLKGAIRIYLVGGGGAGGNWYQYNGSGVWWSACAGGGAGGLVIADVAVTPGAQYSIVIGAGAGAGAGTAFTPNATGNESTAFGYTALGGGAGAQHGGYPIYYGRSGGSGGGSILGDTPGSATQPGSASGGYGNPGGTGNSWGGGGGAGGAGADAGTGGDGYSITLYSGNYSYTKILAAGGGGADSNGGSNNVGGRGDMGTGGWSGSYGTGSGGGGGDHRNGRQGYYGPGAGGCCYIQYWS